MDEKIKTLDSRLDLEVYIMGEMKYEFIDFLTECYKENFYETLSWGNFRRYQLVITGKRNWINIYFFLLKNEMSADVLINSFKAYEKRNSTLILYNVHDQKSKKAAETLQQNLLFERNKFYEGILNENSIKKNMKKLSEEQLELNVEVDTENLKNNLNYLVDNENTLIHKVGFLPTFSNQANKKSKNAKKNENNNSYYEIESKIFYPEQSEKSLFTEVICYLIKQHFNKLNLPEKDYQHFLSVICEFSKNKSGESPSLKKQMVNESPLNYILKSMDWLILLYILLCFFNFLLN